MQDLPRISVVTIVRNDAEGFLITARSILQQNYPHIEWIVVDGLSSDLTSHYVKMLSPQIAKYKIEKDDGIYNAMNKGIDMASGDWLFFMNADDVFYSHDTVSIYVQHMRDGDDFLYSDSERREDGRIKPYLSQDHYWTGMIMDHQTVCGRTGIYKKFHIDESYNIGGDFDFFSKARLSDYSFRKIPWLVGCNRAYEVGASSSFIDRQKDRITVIKKYFNNKPYKPFLTDEYKSRLKSGNLNSEQYSMLLSLL